MVNERLIICGGAPSTMDELAKVPGSGPFDFMLAGAHSPAERQVAVVAHHVSHENDFPKTRAVRKGLALNTDYATWSNRPHPGVGHCVPELTPPTCAYECQPRFISTDPRNHHHYSGSSAMLALKVGLRLGYRKIILAGVAINEGHYAHFQVGWKWIADLLKCCPVRSMGGFTAELLGKPTEEWLK
jgi:hypothetical protein